MKEHVTKEMISETNEMNLQSFLDLYDLHDSGVENILYFPERKELLIHLRLCNWRQRFYKAGEPEIVTGKIVFTGVSAYEIQAEQHRFDEDEILKAEIISSQDGERAAISLILLATYFPGKEQEIKVVRIGADAVAWEAGDK